MLSEFNTATSFVKARWFMGLNSSQKIKKYREKMIIQHCNFLQHNSRYFAHFNAVKKIEDFYKWPLMNKEIMMTYFDQQNTAGLKKDDATKIAIESERTRDFQETYKKYTVGLSSGTSGHRGIFVLSHKEQAQWAGNIIAKLLPKQDLFGQRVAFFLRSNSRLYESSNSKLLSFTFFDIYNSIQDNATKLVSYNPSILIAPPSALKEIIEELEKQGKEIHPKKVISVAEVLEPKDEQFIKEKFDLPIIHQVYQCTEGFIACSCDKGTLHINEDILYLEKEQLGDNRFIPIITDFRRKTQPIVRYRLNDVLIDSNKSCSCGSAFSVIEKVEGRQDDVFTFESPEGKKVSVYPDMLSRCILYVDDIENYRITQDYSKIVIYIDNLQLQVQANIRHELELLSKKLGFELPEIRFEKYFYDPRKKMKRIVRIT